MLRRLSSGQGGEYAFFFGWPGFGCIRFGKISTDLENSEKRRPFLEQGRKTIPDSREPRRRTKKSPERHRLRLQKPFLAKLDGREERPQNNPRMTLERPQGTPRTSPEQPWNSSRKAPEQPQNNPRATLEQPQNFVTSGAQKQVPKSMPKTEPGLLPTLCNCVSTYLKIEQHATSSMRS